MPARLPDHEREHIADLIRSGKSCSAVAKDVGRSPDTVSRIAREIGWHFGDTNLAHAHEARSAYSAERRATIAAKATERAQQLLDEFEGEYLVFNFGGKENTYNEHTLPSPPIEARRQMAAAFRDLMRTVLEVDKHDNRNDEGLAAVDAWLRDIVGAA